MFKNRFAAAKSMVSRGALRASVAVAGTVGAMGQALAQVAPVDITTVKTSIDSAGSQGTTVGGYIIGAIAVLAGIGVIIAVVKKL